MNDVTAINKSKIYNTFQILFLPKYICCFFIKKIVFIFIIKVYWGIEL